MIYNDLHYKKMHSIGLISSGENKRKSLQNVEAAVFYTMKVNDVNTL